MKSILITGVSKGLGVEIAQRMLNGSYSVINISRSETDEITLFKKLFPNSFYSYQIDLSNLNEENINKIKSIIKDHNINYFVNNAAMAYDDIVSNLNLDELDKMFRVNVYSPFLITKYIIRNCLLNNSEGSIIHISSISVHTGYKGLAMYAASKGALEAFSLNTSREWAERGIRSNCIVAGFMETNMTSELSIEKINRIKNRTSQKKLTSLESVAGSIAFLISDDSKSITGSNLFVDSGTI